MPTLIKLYVAAFVLILALNALFGRKLKIRPLFLFYELLAGVYLLFCVVAYWEPAVRALMGLANIPGVLLIIATDCHYSLRGDPDDLGADLPEVSETEFELSKAASIMFASPAYVISSLLAWDIVAHSL